MTLHTSSPINKPPNIHLGNKEICKHYIFVTSMNARTYSLSRSFTLEKEEVAMEIIVIRCGEVNRIDDFPLSNVGRSQIEVATKDIQKNLKGKKKPQNIITENYMRGTQTAHILYDTFGSEIIELNSILPLSVAITKLKEEKVLKENSIIVISNNNDAKMLKIHPLNEGEWKKIDI